MIKSKKIRILPFIIGFILMMYSFALVGAFYLTFIASLKSIPDFAMNPLNWPKEFMFSNYARAFDGMYIQVDSGESIQNIYLWQMLFNSLIYSVGCAVASTMVPCIVAYMVAKYKNSFNKIIYGAVIVAMILPIVGALPSEIQVSRMLGLYDNVIGQWIMKGSFLGMYFLVFYSTFKSLSKEYSEAAFIDGASHLTVMLKIMIPLVKTGIFAVMVIMFITFWNDYQVPLIYLPSFPTAAVGLYIFTFNSATNDLSSVPMQMAGCLILFFPIFIVFLIFRDAFMGNLTVGGIKG